MGADRSSHGPQFTDEQEKAVRSTGVSVVLSSGAGCGKTSVLTGRYLELLRRGGPTLTVDRIVAITFTERAAREMRGRIRSAVVQERDSAIADNDSVTADLWDTRLRDLESAPIQTIHSFCTSILRENAYAVGRDPGFEVLDAILAENVRSAAVREHLHRQLIADDATAGPLRRVAERHGWHACKESIAELIRRIHPESASAWLKRPIEEVAAEWRERFHAEAFQSAMAEFLGPNGPFQPFVAFTDAHTAAGPITRDRIAELRTRIPTLTLNPKLPDQLDELFETAKVVTAEGKKAWAGDDEVKAEYTELLKNLREEVVKQLVPIADIDTDWSEIVSVGRDFIECAIGLQETYGRHKRRLNTVDFDDLLNETHGILRADSALRTRLRNRYRYLLLDEMQDTDPVQMEIIESLWDPAQEPDKVFAVGDSKQSIYRFRGADVSIFERLRRSVPQEGRLSLTRNFRSRTEIIRFVNALFRRHMDGYEPLRGDPKDSDPRSRVEFLWSGPAEEMKNVPVDESRGWDAEAIAGRIEELLADPTEWVSERSGSTRRIRPGDITLLFRAMNSTPIYESALRRKGIDYYLVGGRAFYSQQEIYDVLNLLRALENPADVVCLAGVLRSPFGLLSDNALAAFADHRGGFSQGFLSGENDEKLAHDDRTQTVRFREMFVRWRRDKDRGTISGLIGQVVEESGYDAAVQYEPLGDRKLANLWKLQEIAAGFDDDGRFGLRDFIDRLDDMVSREPKEEQAATTPENADVVRIMSIHQSKGLEFPVVFVPDFNADMKAGHSNGAEWDAEMGCVPFPPKERDEPVYGDMAAQLYRRREAAAEDHEHRRILYVACTRAADRLILSHGFKKGLPPAPPGCPTPVPDPANTFMAVLAEQFDVLTGRCLDDGVLKTAIPNITIRRVEPTFEPTTVPPPGSGAGSAPPNRPDTPVEIDPAYWHPVPPGPLPAEIDVSQCSDPAAESTRRGVKSWSLRAEGRSIVLRPFADSAWPQRLSASSRLRRNIPVAIAAGHPFPADTIVYGEIDFRAVIDGRMTIVQLAPASARSAVQALANALRLGSTDEPPIVIRFDPVTGDEETLDPLEPVDWTALMNAVTAQFSPQRGDNWDRLP